MTGTSLSLVTRTCRKDMKAVLPIIITGAFPIAFLNKLFVSIQVIYQLILVLIQVLIVHLIM